ncbi:MAG: PKD domain-containing protein [Chloroflexota bacterium]
MGKFKIYLFLLFFSLMVSVAQAGVTYGGAEYPHLSIMQPTTVYDFPSLYTDLVSTYGESYTKENILNETSPGVWRCAAIIDLPQDVPFYINSSTANEVHMMRDHTGAYCLTGYPIVNNTKIIGWDRTTDQPSNYIGVYGQTVCASVSIHHQFHDVRFENLLSVNAGGTDHTYYNVSTWHVNTGLSFGAGDNMTGYNISLTDGAPAIAGDLGGFVVTGSNNSTFYDIYVNNISDPSLGSTCSYGFYQSGRNSYFHDIYINGTGYTGVNVGGIDGANSSNDTFENITVNLTGHNGFEVELNNSVFRNITVSNSSNFNFFQAGRVETNKTVGGNVYESIHSSYPGGHGIVLGEGSFNTTILNSTFNGKGIYFSTSDNCSAINCTQSGITGAGNANLFYYYDNGNPLYRYCINNSFIDCHISDNHNLDFHFDEGATIFSFINTYSTWTDKIMFVSTTHKVTRYYYPNVVVKNTAGQPIKDAIITLNETARNGHNKIQSEFISDENGKLYDSGNRSNWLAVPEYYFSSSLWAENITTITATKNGLTDSEIINPDTTWYSANPASLSGPEIVLTLDTSGATPIANFSADTTSGSYPLKVNFTDNSTNNPTSWAWDFDGNGIVDSTAQNPSCKYKTQGNYTVVLTVENEDGSNNETKVGYIHVTKPSIIIRIFDWFGWIFKYFLGYNLVQYSGGC